MEIQHHDGVVVEVAGSRQGFAKRKRGGRGVTGGRGRRQGLDLAALPPPTIYRAKGEGGAALALPPRKTAAREGSILPKAPQRCLPLLGLSPPLVPLAHGPLGAGALGPYRPRHTPYSPCGPPG